MIFIVHFLTCLVIFWMSSLMTCVYETLYYMTYTIVRDFLRPDSPGAEATLILLSMCNWLVPAHCIEKNIPAMPLLALSPIVSIWFRLCFKPLLPLQEIYHVLIRSSPRQGDSHYKIRRLRDHLIFVINISILRGICILKHVLRTLSTKKWINSKCVNIHLANML